MTEEAEDIDGPAITVSESCDSAGEEEIKDETDDYFKPSPQV